MCPPGAVLCSVHDPARKGGTFEASDEPLVILRRLLKDRDPRVRLRAVNAFLALKAKEERGCPRCAETSANDEHLADTLRRGTPEQLDRLRDLIRATKELRAVMVTQPVYTAPDQVESLEPSHVDTAPPAVSASTDVSEPPAVSAGMDAAAPDPVAGLEVNEEEL